MQNAADAGALAGAWEICFGAPSMAADRAFECAVGRNGAETAGVSVGTWKVTVRASESVDTHLAGLIGVPTSDVGATAEAVCGAANLLCGVWPLSFHMERWDRTACWDEGDPVDVGRFYVFNDGRFEEDDPCFNEVDWVCHPPCDILDEDGNVEVEGVCACSLKPPDRDALVVGPGHRGWLLFPRPRPSFDHVTPNCTDNCGDQVRCWIDNGPYGWAIPTGSAGSRAWTSRFGLRSRTIILGAGPPYCCGTGSATTVKRCTATPRGMLIRSSAWVAYRSLTSWRLTSSERKPYDPQTSVCQRSRSSRRGSYATAAQSAAAQPASPQAW